MTGTGVVQRQPGGEATGPGSGDRGADGTMARGEGPVAASAAALWLGVRLAPSGPVPAALGLAAVPVGLGLVGLSIALLSRPRRPRRLVAGAVTVPGLVGLALLGVVLAGRADAGYRSRPPGPLNGAVTVLDDPRPAGVAGWRIELRLGDGGRVEATGYGRAGTTLSRAGVGDVLAVEGRLQEVGDRPWLRTRHIVARASIAEAHPVAGPGPIRAGVEWARDRVAAGADTLDERPAALYRGLVLGDDRFQPPGQRLRFRISGLSHLLAVSGQNVAFVLTAAGPALRSLRHRYRLGAVLGVVVLFAVITRLEPSVLRAATAASLAAWGSWSGRARSGVTVLAAAVMGLIVADPFLVDAAGFQLSVAASAGILVLGPALARRLPGPELVVQPLATTLSAQVGVAPVLATHFGPMSLVAVPANLAAGWAAAGVMTAGMSVGVLAGMAPGPVAALLQLPVRAMLWWLEAVAAVGARLPDPRPGLLLLTAVAVVLVVARDLRSRVLTGAAVAVVAAVLVVTVPRPPDRPAVCAAGIIWYPGDDGSSRSVLVVGEGARVSSVEDCRVGGVRGVDLVVVERGDRAAGSLVAALGEVMSVGEVWAPPQHAIVGARRRLEPVVVPTGSARLTIGPDGDRALRVTAAGP